MWNCFFVTSKILESNAFFLKNFFFSLYIYHVCYIKNCNTFNVLFFCFFLNILELYVDSMIIINLKCWNIKEKGL